MAITDGGVVIRTHADQINKVGRASVGVRMMKTGNKKIVSVAVVTREEDQPDEERIEEQNLEKVEDNKIEE